jgi:hypothetical protein
MVSYRLHRRGQLVWYLWSVRPSVCHSESVFRTFLRNGWRCLTFWDVVWIVTDYKYFDRFWWILLINPYFNNKMLKDPFCSEQLTYEYRFPLPIFDWIMPLRWTARWIKIYNRRSMCGFVLDSYILSLEESVFLTLHHIGWIFSTRLCCMVSLIATDQVLFCYAWTIFDFSCR